MYIGLAAVVLSCLLCLGAYPAFHLRSILHYVADCLVVVRQMLIQANNLLAYVSESEALKEVNRQRFEDAARLEGISVDEAVERKKGFRYLY